MTLLKNPVLLISLAILCTTATAAPTPVVDPVVPKFISEADMEALTGPISSNWRDRGLLPPEWKEREEREWQQERVAFRQFSERVVSTHCSSVLGSTLDLLDSVRDFVHDHLEVKESFDLLEPVLATLKGPLRMNEEFNFEEELSDEELEEKRRKDKEEQEEERRTSFPSLSPEEKKYREMIWNFERQSRTRSVSWTEENEPQLLLRYRLRHLEKMMAVFPFVLGLAPDPVRQELEESGFVQKTGALQEEVRSLLTCEGVQHVTVAQLKDAYDGDFESDRFMDRSAASQSINIFHSDYHLRLFMEVSTFSRASRPYSWEESCELSNTTCTEDLAPAKNMSDDKQQLKDQDVEGQVVFKTPEVQFAWTWEAIVRLWKATGHENDYRMKPEVIALLFKE
ncbi:hypothetical protein EMPS_10802 [Entomortierella parvispora]|uniref:Uncharacterized protein n=1 Tax=Entomortierella parvispora TaxID=205924 RepID=A0A9P3M1M3_9FUNG|nr:hypothetical protein EMPS_10802 [Entomortierella parvispora]